MSSQTDKITENIVKAKIDKYRLEQGISEQQYIDMNAKEKQEVYIQSIRDFGVDDFGKTLISLLDSSLRRSLPQDIINDSYVYNDLMTSSLNHLLILSNESNIALDFTNYDNISGIMNMSIRTAIKESTITNNKLNEIEKMAKNVSTMGIFSAAAILADWEKATPEQKQKLREINRRNFKDLIDKATTPEQKERLKQEEQTMEEVYESIDENKLYISINNKYAYKHSKNSLKDIMQIMTPEIRNELNLIFLSLGIDYKNVSEEKMPEILEKLDDKIEKLINIKISRTQEIESNIEKWLDFEKEHKELDTLRIQLSEINSFLRKSRGILNKDYINQISTGSISLDMQKDLINTAYNHTTGKNEQFIFDMYDITSRESLKHIDTEQERKLIYDTSNYFREMDIIRSIISNFKGPQDEIAGFINELTTSTAYIEYAKKLPTHDGGTKQKDLTGFFENLQRQIALATIDFAQFGEREYSLEQKKQGAKALEESAKTGKVIFEIVDKYMPIFQKNEDIYMEKQAKDLSYTINDTETSEVKTIEEMLHETTSALLDSKDIDENGQPNNNLYSIEDVRGALKNLTEILNDEDTINLQGKDTDSDLMLAQIKKMFSLEGEDLSNEDLILVTLLEQYKEIIIDDSKRQELIDAIDKQVKELESEERPISNFETEDFLAGNFVEMNIDAITTDRSQDMPTQENEEKIDEDKVDTATPTEEQYKVEEIIVGAESKAEEIAREESDFDILADDDVTLASTSTSNPESNALVTTNERTGFLGAITTFINNIRTALYQTNNEKDEQGEKKSFFRRFIDKYNEIKESQNNKSSTLKIVPETDVTKETEKSEELSQTGSVYDAKKPIDQYIVNTQIAPLKESTPKTVKDEEPVISDDEIR